MRPTVSGPSSSKNPCLCSNDLAHLNRSGSFGEVVEGGEAEGTGSEDGDVMAARIGRVGRTPTGVAALAFSCTTRENRVSRASEEDWDEDEDDEAADDDDEEDDLNDDDDDDGDDDE